MRKAWALTKEGVAETCKTDTKMCAALFCLNSPKMYATHLFAYSVATKNSLEMKECFGAWRFLWRFGNRSIILCRMTSLEDQRVVCPLEQVADTTP